MDLKKIKEIIDMPLIGQDDKETLIIQEISKNNNALPLMLEMLNSERLRKRELMLDMNELLSKADMIIKEPRLNEPKFIREEIAEFYKTTELNHCFKNPKPKSKFRQRLDEEIKKHKQIKL